ncbi:MAG: hypothetical protein HZC36_14215 [Armatimonadetes bacterium]|nr:hypothetical protein [Armatimonadota bacterium]
MAYLQSVSQYEDLEVQTTLAEILCEMDLDGHLFLQHDRAVIAQRLPPELAARISVEISKWIRSLDSIPMHIEDAFVDLSLKLYQEGAATEAHNLIWSVLHSLPPRSAPGERVFNNRTRFRVDGFSYSRALSKVFPEMLKAEGISCLRALCAALGRILDFDYSAASKEEGLDFSGTWRCRISEDETPPRHQPKEELVSKIRDAAFHLGHVELQPVVELLRANRWEIFARILRHVLSQFPEAPLELVEPHIDINQLLRDNSMSPETWEMVSSHWKRLPSPFRTQLLRAISEGPEIGDWPERYKEHNGHDLPDSVRDAYALRWQCERTQWISSAVNDDERAIVQRAIDSIDTFRANVAEEPKGVFHPTSPKNSQELSAMSDNDLIQYMSEWSSDDQKYWYDRHALLAEWKDVVSSSPVRILELGERLPLLPLDARSAAIDAFEQLVRQGKLFPVDPALDFVVETVHSEPNDKSDVNHRALNFIESIMQKGVAVAGNAQRDRVWQIINRVAQIPSPNQVYEEDYGPPNMNWTMLALNTTRPRAIYVAIRYALWINGHLIDDPMDPNHIHLPDEVRELLTAAASDSSHAVRAPFGEFLPWLAKMDERWLLSVLGELLPEDSERGTYFDACWEGYVCYSSYFDDSFMLLREKYRTAIALQDFEGDSHEDRPALGTASHILIAFQRGLEDLSEESLMSGLLAKASSKFIADLLTNLGRGYRDRKEIMPNVIARLVELWQYIKERIVPLHSLEDQTWIFEAFTTWFTCNIFDRSWKLEQFEDALQKMKAVSDIPEVIKVLSSYASEQPTGVATSLTFVVSRPVRDWSLSIASDEIAELLSNLENSSVDAARTKAREARDELVRRGHLDFVPKAQ